MSALLAVRGLCCVRDGRVLFENLELNLEAGELLYLQGANGAGKTSLLRLLAGLLPARSGEILWRGQAAHADRLRFYRELLFIGHSPGLNPDLSAWENLRFLQSLSGRRGDPDQALAAIGLAGREDLPVRYLSAGQRRRAALARLWLSDATLWLLDEPLTALDAAAAGVLSRRFGDHARRGGCAIFSSHQPLELPGLRHLALA